jgi:hypothetical protein
VRVVSIVQSYVCSTQVIVAEQLGLKCCLCMDQICCVVKHVLLGAERWAFAESLLATHIQCLLLVTGGPGSVLTRSGWGRPSACVQHVYNVGSTMHRSWA